MVKGLANNRIQSHRRDNATGYTGVTKCSNRYKAQISLNGKRITLGRYDTIKEAALSYDRAAHKKGYPAAQLNFPKMANKSPSTNIKNSFQSQYQQRKQRFNSTGFKGVYRKGQRFQAQCRIGGRARGSATSKCLGTFDTKEEAAHAYDDEAILRGDASVSLNFPRRGYTTIKNEVVEKTGKTKDNKDKTIKKRRKCQASSGFKGVYEKGGRFQTQCRINGVRTYLGTYTTLKEAAMAWDRAAVKRGDAANNLNYPKINYKKEFQKKPNRFKREEEEEEEDDEEEETDEEDDEEEEEEEEKEKETKRLKRSKQSKQSIRKKRTSKTGFTGVYEKGQRYQAQCRIGGYQNLGTFRTKREAALAYDRAAIQTGYACVHLNFPKMVHTKKKTAPVVRKRGRKRQSNNASGHTVVSKKRNSDAAQITINHARSKRVRNRAALNLKREEDETIDVPFDLAGLTKREQLLMDSIVQSNQPW